MIGESGLAGVNRRLEMQKAAVQLGAYAAMALVAVARRRRCCRSATAAIARYIAETAPSSRS